MLEVLIHTLKHTLKDSLNLLPFLFIAFLIIEFIEHKLSKRVKKFITKSGKFGPILGSVLGLIPQCGVSVMATNFYITRVISLGCLFSIYLSTSDEMLPIMISRGVSFKVIFSILLIKFVTGFVFGYIIDFIFKSKNKKFEYEICDTEHCDCEHGVIKSSLKHTLSTFIYIVITSFIITFLYEQFGESLVSKIFMKDSLFGPFVGSLVGLIPNCGASIALSELYLNSAISFGTCIAGLLTGSGVAILILFKSNKNIKENIFIVISLYLIGVLIGIFLDFMGILL
ncbi:MAG: arsenic efflux protein [Bacilli bacterium]|nr:arsenic efflux protein [Bacilli bacterium]